MGTRQWMFRLCRTIGGSYEWSQPVRTWRSRVACLSEGSMAGSLEGCLPRVLGPVEGQ